MHLSPVIFRLNLYFLDFGLAKVYGLKDRKGAGGTPYYMAPEVLDSAPFDSKADVYAYAYHSFFFINK